MEESLATTLAICVSSIPAIALIGWLFVKMAKQSGKDNPSQHLYSTADAVMVDKPGGPTPYYIEDMMHGTGYHRAINIQTGEEKLIRESNVIEVL